MFQNVFNPTFKSPQVEILVEELQRETLKEFERIKIETLNVTANIKTKHIDNINNVFRNLTESIDLLVLQQKSRKEHIYETEKLYKETIKQIHNFQQSLWLKLVDCIADSKNEIRKYYLSAKQVVDDYDPKLDKAYKNCKHFLDKHMRDTYLEVKQIGVGMQEEIVEICKNAKKNQK